MFRFFGTDEQTRPPPYGPETRVRREMFQVANNEMSEQERKTLMSLQRKPGESQEAYEQRRRIVAKLRRNEGEWKWVIEDPRRGERWEGKEDMTQTTNYAIIFPSTNPNEPIKVALLDHWIEMRKLIDNADRLKEIKQQKQADMIQEIRRKQEEDVKRAARSVKNSGTFKREKPSFVRGRESEAESKSYRTRGAIDSDDEDNDRGGNKTQDGLNLEEYYHQEYAVDHDHELAIDRMQYDGDEFQENDYEFDDDDEGLDDYAEGEDLHDLAEGEVYVTEAAIAEEQENMEEEDEEGDRSGSEEEEDDEEEEEEDAPDRPISRVPDDKGAQATTTTTSRSPSPTQADGSMAAASASMPPVPSSSTVDDLSSGPLLLRLKRFIFRQAAQAPMQRIRDLKKLLDDARKFFRDDLDNKLFGQAVHLMLKAVDDTTSGKYFVLRDITEPKS